MRRRAFLAASFLAGSALSLPRAIAQSEVPVLVARQDIPAHTKLDETMVTPSRIPARYVQPGALSKTDQLLGQISAVNIAKGTQILAAMVSSLDDVGMAFKIPAGFRSFTFPVDAGGPLGDVRPGNYVDLVWLAPKGKGSVATTLAQNVYVLAVGSDSGAFEVLEPGETPHRRRRDDPPTISVMLTPDEVARMALAIETGVIRVSLRSLWEGNTQVAIPPAVAPLPLRKGR